MKKLLTILIAGMFLLTFVAAQGNQYNSQNQEEITEMKQQKNMFQNKYNFECSGECDYSKVGEQTRLEVREQKRFLFWNVESLDTYDMNEEGELVQAKYNFWSRILNRNKVGM